METEQKDCNCEGDEDCDIEEMVDNNSFVLDTLMS